MRGELVDIIYSFNEEYRYEIYEKNDNLYYIWLQQKVYDDYGIGEMEFVCWTDIQDYLHKTDCLERAYEIGNEGLRCLGGNYITVKEAKCKWLEKFAANISEEDKEEHITSSGNYLWHTFSWNYVEAIAGDRARAELEKLRGKKMYGFNELDSDEEIIKEYDEIELEFIENELDEDIYLFDESFKWTYVKTHESMCGPYFFNV